MLSFISPVTSQPKCEWELILKDSEERHDQAVKNIGMWTQQQDLGKSWRHEYQLAMLWRHRRAFTWKLTGFETTIVITRIILKLNLWDFLMTSTIALLKMLISCNNSLRVSVLSLWRSKDRKNHFVINEIWKLIIIKLLIFRFHKGNLIISINMVLCWSKSSISLHLSLG